MIMIDMITTEGDSSTFGEGNANKRSTFESY